MRRRVGALDQLGFDGPRFRNGRLPRWRSNLYHFGYFDRRGRGIVDLRRGRKF